MKAYRKNRHDFILKSFDFAKKSLEDVVADFESYIKYLEHTVGMLEKSNDSLRKNAKKFMDRELVERNEVLERNAKFSFGQFDSEKELKAYRDFCERHAKCQMSLKVNNGKVPFVKEDCVGVGICKKAVCQICGEEKDITDISVW